MKHLLYLGLTALLASCATDQYGRRAPRVVDAGPVYRASLRYVSTEDSEFEPDEPTGFGVALESTGRDSGTGWELGAWAAEDDETGPETDLREISFGFRQNFGTQSRIAPFIGAGLAWIEGEVSSPSNSISDHSFAGYGQAGIRVQPSDFAFIDFGLRALVGSDVDLGASNTDLDYTQAFIGVGASF